MRSREKNTVYNQMLGTVGGTQAISVYTVISRIQSFLTTPFTGVMQGIQPLIGFSYGRKDKKRVERTVIDALRFKRNKIETKYVEIKKGR